MAETKDEMTRQLEWFIEHQQQLCKKHCGKYLAIASCQVIGTYDDRAAAHSATRRDHKPGTFIIQHCIPGVDAYSINVGAAWAVSRNS